MKLFKLHFKKIILIFTLFLFSITGFFIGTIYGDEIVRLFVDGKEIYCEVPPFIKGGRTFVPLRCVVEALQIPVKWNNAKRAVLVGIPPEGVDLVNDIPAFEGYENKIKSYVTIGGTKYNNGYALNGLNYPIPKFLRFNLGKKYNTFKFNWGFADGTRETDQEYLEIIIECDGEEIERIKTKSGLGLQ